MAIKMNDIMMKLISKTRDINDCDNDNFDYDGDIDDENDDQS
jgi:hypothetical protein